MIVSLYRRVRPLTGYPVWFVWSSRCIERTERVYSSSESLLLTIVVNGTRNCKKILSLLQATIQWTVFIIENCSLSPILDRDRPSYRLPCIMYRINFIVFFINSRSSLVCTRGVCSSSKNSLIFWFDALISLVMFIAVMYTISYCHTLFNAAFLLNCNSITVLLTLC